LPKFTVDTHLFRELGELLVGRDSTALVELIKNSYDADATEVTVFGENLDKPRTGRITISDNGVGMTSDTFERGFLRIASRLKEHGDRRSPRYKRRFTGAKGVGRLAIQKLAWKLSLEAVADPKVFGRGADSVSASIDWSLIDACETLDDDGVAQAVTMEATESDALPGTKIELNDLRGTWTSRERTRVIREVTTFQPPEVLLGVPRGIVTDSLLLKTIAVRDVVNRNDPGFSVTMQGDFDVGEEYWSVIAQAADWILEIKTDRVQRTVDYLITPTTRLRDSLPSATQHEFHWDAASALANIPSLHARILVREGSEGIKKSQRGWLVDSGGVRIYMEGFRVLPYGDAGDDWLEIDFDYAQRSRALRFLDEASLDLSRFGERDEDVGLLALRNTSYFGAVFLTRDGTPQLEMLVNREGFIPNASFLSLQRIIRVGIDLSARVRAFEKQPVREERRLHRLEGAVDKARQTPKRMIIREAAEESAKKATDLAQEARSAAASGQHEKAQRLIVEAVQEIERGTGFTGELVTDRSIMQILAGVGLQMSAFVHELNGLLGMASAVETALTSLREKLQLDAASRRELAKVNQNVSDLRRAVERQASYLTDITSPDARRRRSRQKLHERFDVCLRLVQRAADKRRITIENRIPDDLKSPSMFPAELMVVFSNLLTNAIKACRQNGRIRATGRSLPEGAVRVTLQNTGRRVRLADAEKWFLPFKSTTVESDPVLGQGMGMGLPIVRNILEEYGADIRFVKPSEEFATAIDLTFA
jgi:signal transduction histidine kinase